METDTIGDSDTIYTTFIENSANCQLLPVDDFILKTDHGYDDGDKVYFYFFAGNTSYTGIDDSETTVNPYYVYNSNNIAFQVVTTPASTSPEGIFDTADAQVSQASANLALANLNSTIVSSLGTSQVNTGTIISISTTDNGYGYYSGTPIGTVTFGQIAEQQLTDGFGGILGENAEIQTNYLYGSVAQNGGGEAGGKGGGGGENLGFPQPAWMAPRVCVSIPFVFLYYPISRKIH